VVTVSDGVELLGCLTNNGVAAAIIELELPRVSGVGVASTAKDLKLPVPIIAVTGVSPEEVSALPLPPIVAVIHKPVHVN